MARTIDQIKSAITYWTDEVERRKEVYGNRSKEHMVALNMVDQNRKRLNKLCPNSEGVVVKQVTKTTRIQDAVATLEHLLKERNQYSSHETEYKILSQRIQRIWTRLKSVSANLKSSCNPNPTTFQVLSE